MVKVEVLNFRALWRHRMFIDTNDTDIPFFGDKYVIYMIYGYIDTKGEMKYAIEAGIDHLRHVHLLFQYAKHFSYHEIMNFKVIASQEISTKYIESVNAFEQYLNTKYVCDAKIQKVRYNCFLDAYRNPDFPDVLTCEDVSIHRTIQVKALYYDGNYLMGEWCHPYTGERCKSVIHVSSQTKNGHKYLIVYDN